MNSIKNNLPKIIFNNQKLKHFENFHIFKSNNSQATAALQYVTANTILYLMKTYRTIKNKLEGKKPVVKEYPKDTVILYHFPRAFYLPTNSPPALKLETWCRAANIKYKNAFGMARSSQGLVPFIRLNDYQVEDSVKCIDYLSKVYQVDLNSHLTVEQKAIARAVLALCEDRLRWCLVLHRFGHSKNTKKETGLPLLAIWSFRYRVFRAGVYSGYGRFTKEELYEIGKKDLTTLNTLIGNKKYLFSDNKPCDVDFSIFGVCAQIKYTDRGPLNNHLTTECHNVVRHIENIKQTYWPDWNDVILSNKLVKQNKPSILSLFKSKVKK